MDLPHLEPGELYPRQENGYPFIYFTEDGGILCPDCANGGNGSLANANEEDPQWHLIAMDVHWEGPPEQCDHCGAEVESAYDEAEDLAERIRGAITDAEKAGFEIRLQGGGAAVVADYLEERGLRDAQVLSALRNGSWVEVMYQHDDRWQVVVGNIGTVYDGVDEEEARHHYEEYVGQSMTGMGRAGNEEVVLFHSGDEVASHIPHGGD